MGSRVRLTRTPTMTLTVSDTEPRAAPAIKGTRLWLHPAPSSLSASGRTALPTLWHGSPSCVTDGRLLHALASRMAHGLPQEEP